MRIITYLKPTNMKKRFNLHKIELKFIALLLLLSTSVYGQQLAPQDAEIVYEKTTRPCLAITVEPGPDLLRSEWIDYLRKQHGVKLKGDGFLTNKDVLYAEKIVIEAVSEKALDLYAEIILDENGTTSMKVFAAFGYDIFIEKTSYPNEYQALKEIMSSFLNTYIPDYYNQQLEEVQDHVKDLSKSEGKLEKSIKKNTKKIKKMTKDVEDMQEENAKNETELEEVKSTLKSERERLTELKAKINAL